VSQRLKADAALTLCTVLWGATFVVVKGALNSASVFAFMAVRFTLAAVLMAATFRRALGQVTRAEIRACQVATARGPRGCSATRAVFSRDDAAPRDLRET
jgi:drug/metabolite transporter (DMT)-like permease